MDSPEPIAGVADLPLRPIGLPVGVDVVEVFRRPLFRERTFGGLLTIGLKNDDAEMLLRIFLLGDWSAALARAGLINGLIPVGENRLGLF